MKQKMKVANVFSSRLGVDLNGKNKTTFKMINITKILFLPDKLSGLCEFKQSFSFLCVLLHYQAICYQLLPFFNVFERTLPC